jgi:hypothetical protein
LCKIVRSPIISYGVLLPYWLLVTLFAMLPGLWLAGYRRGVREPGLGSCVCCGYHPTANTSGVCPECGTAIVPVASTTPDGNK